MSSLPATKLPPDVRLEYPYAGNLLALPSGASMHYLDEGQGPVVLMLHGNPTWSFYFRRLIGPLVERGFRCIVPDHIGCGLSGKPEDGNYTLEQRIRDISFLVERLNLSSFSLVVHDWGGAIGCGLAVRRAEAIQRLVILNTAAFRSKRIPARIAVLKLPFLGQLMIRGLNAFAGPAATMAVRKPLSPPVKRGFLWPYRSWRTRVAVWNFVKDIPLNPAHPSYKTLLGVEEQLAVLKEKPMLLFWGARDFCFNRHFFHRWCQLFPEAQTRLLGDCGHYVLEDAESEELERIVEFLHERES
ncbi:MAG: alpha/beta fold hydrolase [Opitutales bacterium]